MKQLESRTTRWRQNDIRAALVEADKRGSLRVELSSTHDALCFRLRLYAHRRKYKIGEGLIIQVRGKAVYLIRAQVRTPKVVLLPGPPAE